MPPNRTTRPFARSNVIAAPCRGDGLVVGWSRPQIVPSQIQVPPATSSITICPRTASMAMLAPCWAGGLCRGMQLNSR